MEGKVLGFIIYPCPEDKKFHLGSLYIRSKIDFFLGSYFGSDVDIKEIEQKYLKFISNLKEGDNVWFRGLFDFYPSVEYELIDGTKDLKYRSEVIIEMREQFIKTHGSASVDVNDLKIEIVGLDQLLKK